MLILYISYKEDTKKLAFASPPTYQLLRQLISCMYDMNNSFFVQYFDEELDPIAIHTDLELLEAVRLNTLNDSDGLNLFIKTNNLNYSNYSAMTDLQEVSIVRKGVSQKMEFGWRKIVNSLSKYFNDLKLKDNIYCIMGMCEKKISIATAQCIEKIEEIKEIIQKQSTLSLEQKITHLKSEIITLLSQMQAQLHIPEHHIPELHIPDEMDTKEDTIEKQDKTVTSNQNLVKVIKDDVMLSPSEDDKIIDVSLYQDDLSQLEELGFVDRVVNIACLIKHNGNMDYVICELLNSY